MKTINEAVGERLSRLKNEKKMDADRRIEGVYRKYPGLKKIEGDLFDVRTSRMICSIEHDDEPLPALKKREEDPVKDCKIICSVHYSRFIKRNADVFKKLDVDIDRYDIRSAHHDDISCQRVDEMQVVHDLINRDLHCNSGKE